MRLIKQIMKQEGVRFWRVPSKSQRGKIYEVREYKGEWSCNCPAIKECSHIKIVKLKL